MLVLKIAGGIILAVVLLTVGCGVLVSASEDEITAELGNIEQEVAESIAAEEAEAAARVDWEWVTDPKCDYGRCWQIRVTSAEGCPDGVYAEMNVLDGSGTVVDYSNDSLGVLPAGRAAVLTFNYLGEGEASGEIAEVTCHDYGS